MEQALFKSNYSVSLREWRIARAKKVVLLLVAGIISYGLYYAGHYWALNISNTFFEIHSFNAPRWISVFFSMYYLFFIVGTVFPFIVFLFWKLLSSCQNRVKSIAPFVSIIIPAFNEEENILKSIKSAIDLDYPAYEIIVIDDGSTDFTMPLIEKTSVKCIKLRQNRGKAAALNEGIKNAIGDIIVFSDSDSVFHRDSLRYMVRHFVDPKVGAVSGKVVLAQTRTMLGRFQALEYMLGQNLIKLAQLGSSSCVTICPGPICAYRRDVLIKMNGFNGRTVAEDFDATMNVIDQDYKVAYEPAAIAYTNVPKTLTAFKKQRQRWCHGTLQVLKLHNKLMFLPRIGSVGYFWMPYFLFIGYGVVVFEFLALLISPVLIILSGAPLMCLKMALGYIVLVEIFCVIQYFIVLFMEEDFDFSLLLSSFIIQPYRFFLSWIKLTVIAHEIQRKVPRWSC